MCSVQGRPAYTLTPNLMGALRLLGLLLAATARASAGADDAESSLLQQRALQKTSCPPIAYLKTHKTGSSLCFVELPSGLDPSFILTAANG